MNREKQIQIDTIEQCVSWLVDRIKSEQEWLEDHKKSEDEFGRFEDCGDVYKLSRAKQEGRVEALIGVKISLEKYAKKLAHEAEELE